MDGTAFCLSQLSAVYLSVFQCLLVYCLPLSPPCHYTAVVGGSVTIYTISVLCYVAHTRSCSCVSISVHLFLFDTFLLFLLFALQHGLFSFMYFLCGIFPYFPYRISIFYHLLPCHFPRLPSRVSAYTLPPLVSTSASIRLGDRRDVTLKQDGNWSTLALFLR